MPVITNPDDLARLLAMPPPVTPGRTVRIEVFGLADDERQRWERRFGFAAGACGCHSGAVLLLAYVLLFGAANVLGRFEWSAWSPLIVLAGAFGAVTVGKLGGLMVGRAALHICVAVFRRRLARIPGADR